MFSRIAGGIGRHVLQMAADVGGLTYTGVRSGRKLLRSLLPGEKFRGRTAILQLHLIGVSAVPIVGLICLMMGLILAFQSAVTHCAESMPPLAQPTRTNDKAIGTAISFFISAPPFSFIIGTAGLKDP